MKKKIKIVLAEDEQSLGKIVKESLETVNFEVLHCLDGEEALLKYQSESPDLLILDVMMPKKDGFTLAKEIRKTDDNIPIIFLTAKSQTQDVVQGFTIGGNDYLKKPFSIEELIVRIQALLKRKNSKENSKIYTIGKYQFNAKSQTLSIRNKTIVLTARESELLQELYLKKNNILERNYILNKLWQNNDFFSARSMDVFISKLRKRLKEDNNIQIINIRGFGYKLVINND